jgi:hypothetical protein
MKCKAVAQFGNCATAYYLHENSEAKKPRRRKINYSASKVIIAPLLTTGSPDFDL